MLQFVIRTPFLGIVSLTAMLLLAPGCGSKVAEQGATAPATGADAQGGTLAKTSADAGNSVTSTLSPTDIVSQFLDRVRRGGQDSDAGVLLTQRAQSELKRIGRSVQPIGSPDAFFNVTRSEAVPGETDSMLVHSIWSEPTSGPSGETTKLDYQVVWAVQREKGQWRISGLAMELQPGQPPTIIDFENGDLMAQLLDDGGDSSESSQPATSQAAADPNSLSR